MVLAPEPSSTQTADSQGSEVDVAEAQVTLLRWVTPAGQRPTALLRAPLVIGRDESCAARLEGSELSRRHAEVRWASGAYLISDLDSKNGVFVNARRQTSAVLRVGDTVRLGDCVAIVEEASPGDLSGFGLLGEGLWGGAALRRVARRAKQAAGERLSIVLEGETGTGKERFARAIHTWSGRSGPFLAVNCAAYTPSTASAELFGYRRGAFTSADRGHAGHVRAADGGSLLLDEIVDLPLETQAVFLRVLERLEVLPLGESRPVSVDVRFLAATQRPLADAVASGKFRADLRARLEGLVLEIPPLRARRADVYPLFELFWNATRRSAAPRIAPRAVEKLCLAEWPLNVRELETVTRRLLALHGTSERIGLRHLSDVAALLFGGNGAPPQPRTERGDGRIRDAYDPERLVALLAALARHGGNLSRAVQELGLSRSKGYRMLRAAKRSRPSSAGR